MATSIPNYMLARGLLLLGHEPTPIAEAVKKQLDQGTIFGSASPEEGTLSRMVCKFLSSVELVRFSKSASEAVHMALQLSWAYTGKTKILKFEGVYHGWFDNILINVHPGSCSLMGLEGAPYPLREQAGIPKVFWAISWSCLGTSLISLKKRFSVMPVK